MSSQRNERKKRGKKRKTWLWQSYNMWQELSGQPRFCIPIIIAASFFFVFFSRRAKALPVTRYSPPFCPMCSLSFSRAIVWLYNTIEKVELFPQQGGKWEGKSPCGARQTRLRYFLYVLEGRKRGSKTLLLLVLLFPVSFLYYYFSSHSMMQTQMLSWTCGNTMPTLSLTGALSCLQRKKKKWKIEKKSGVNEVHQSLKFDGFTLLVRKFSNEHSQLVSSFTVQKKKRGFENAPACLWSSERVLMLSFFGPFSFLLVGLLFLFSFSTFFSCTSPVCGLHDGLSLVPTPAFFYDYCYFSKRHSRLAKERLMDNGRFHVFFFPTISIYRFCTHMTYTIVF